MIRTPMLALIALSLAACGTHSARSDAPSSELDALVRNVERQLPNRTLPNGRQYCAELSETEGQQDLCMGQLEALNLLRHGDRGRALSVLRSGVNRAKAARMRCSWWQFGCKAARRELQQGPDPP